MCIQRTEHLHCADDDFADLNYNTDDDSTDTSTEESDQAALSDDDDLPPLISPSHTTVPETNRSSPTSLHPARPPPVPTISVTVPIVDSFPTQIHDHPPPPIIVNRHETANDEPSTPLTHTTYRVLLVERVVLYDGWW
jgi:hypothetical protein